MKKDKEIYNNFKDADWFNPDLEVLLLGLGSIGSWVGLNLARQGYSIFAFDHDSYEPHNLGSQLSSIKDIGNRKDEVFKQLSLDYASNSSIELMGKYEEDSPTGNIVISAFDNMSARRLAFRKWKEAQLEKTKEYRIDHPSEINIFIDGRLTIELGYIYAVTSKYTSDLYEQTLFEDSEVAIEPCSYRQSTHSGMIMGGLITSILLNQIANKMTDIEMRYVPFKTEFELLTLEFQCSNK